MTLYNKISVLGPSARFDICGPKDFGTTTKIPGVYHAKAGGSNVCRLFKVLQTNYCKNNCNYCAFRRDRNCQREQLTSDEMAKAFDLVYKKNLVDGFFLSSGILGKPDQTMEKIINTASIVRQKYEYKGYMHLKIMPGSSESCIQETVKLASRISLNIESPTEDGLSFLSPDKIFKKGFFYTLSLIKKVMQKLKFSGKRIPSLTTQFVVGAGSEKDREILKVTHLLYKNFGLKRIFYSAFKPVKSTPLEEKQPASQAREHRLYQVDFLMRFYHFSPWDIPLNSEGNLFEDEDPKFAWAKQNQHLFPMNLNKANFFKLIKIPGIGPVSAKKIINLRKEKKIKNWNDLQGKRINFTKAKPFTHF
jgi:predicted DNA-binding helix-hairpin-helix protein